MLDVNYSHVEKYLINIISETTVLLLLFVWTASYFDIATNALITPYNWIIAVRKKVVVLKLEVFINGFAHL